MRNYRKLCAAVVLALTIITPTFAGHMSTPVAPPDPPPPSATTMEATLALQDESTGSESAIDPVLGVALDVLQSVLSLL